MPLTNFIFNFLPEGVAEILDDKIKKSFVTLKDGNRLKKFLEDIDETINSKCISLVDQFYINDQEAIKNRFKNYNIVQKIFDYWIGINLDYFCSEEMINDLVAQIVEENNTGSYSEIKTLLGQLNNRIFNWLSENTKDDQKTFLFVAKRFDISNGRQFRINGHNELTVQDDYRTINLISKRLCKTIFDHIQNDNVSFDSKLFGKISVKKSSDDDCDENFSNLMEIGSNSLPSVLFLTAAGGVGKTTHLQKFQSDIFASLVDKETQEKSCYIPIFVSLTNMGERKSIKDYITENYPLSDAILNKENLGTVFAQRNSLICYVILLDGLNEYRGKTEDLFDEINTIRQNGNVKFIITSRNSLSDVKIPSDKLRDITEAAVEHISIEQARNYFNIDSFSPDYNDKTLDLLTTPFYMVICKKLRYDFTDGHNINAGMLMHRYMNYNIARLGENDGIIIGEILPYLCYIRYKEDSLIENNTPKGEVALTSFGRNSVDNVVKKFNNIFGQGIECDAVIKTLLEYNFITKTKQSFVRYNFKHQNIRDIYAAYHVARTAWLILECDEAPENFGSEIDMHAELNDFSNDVADAVLVYLFEEIKNGDFPTGNSNQAVLCGEDENLSKLRNSNNLIILEILDKISSEAKDCIIYSQKFIENYEKCKNKKLKKALANMYIHALCQSAQYYRRLIIPETDALKSFEICLERAERAKSVYLQNTQLSSDGYNHIGKCFNSFLEYVLNKLNDMTVVEDANYSLVKKAMEETVYADSIMNKCRHTVNDITKMLLPILSGAREAYNWYREKSEKDSRVFHVLAVHYVSRAYMTEACLKNSAESLNLMAMIFENDYNLKLRGAIFKKFNVDVTCFKSFGDDRLEYSYSLYDAASKCSHVVRGYSAQKKAIMLIKQSAHPKEVKNINAEIEMDLNISKRAYRPLTDYWYGRFYQDICNNLMLSEAYYRKEMNNHSGNILVKIEMLHFYPVNEMRLSDSVFINNALKINFNSLNDEEIHKLNSVSKLQNEIFLIIKSLKDQKYRIENQELNADKFFVTCETVEENLQRFHKKLHILLKKWEEHNANE